MDATEVPPMNPQPIVSVDNFDSQVLDEAANAEEDAAYHRAMLRLHELKQKPIDQLTEQERKEKLRLANRESARKMRRKQAESLVTAEQHVHELEAGYAEAMTALSAEWFRYREIQAQNDQLRSELQALRGLVSQEDGESQGHGGQAADEPTHGRSAGDDAGVGARALQEAEAKEDVAVPSAPVPALEAQRAAHMDDAGTGLPMTGEPELSETYAEPVEPSNGDPDSKS